MGLFRRRPADAAGGPPDEDFPFFSVERAARFRAVAYAAFAEKGVEGLISDGALSATDGRRFGLYNLAAICHQAGGGTKQWPTLAAEHVDKMLRAMSGDLGFDGEPDEVLAHTYLRLSRADAFPTQEVYRYAREVAPGLVELFALDQPETVAMFNDEKVARLGEETLREAGLRNLIAEPIDEHESVALEDGARFHVAMGESVFVASKLLILPDLIRRTIGDVDTPFGVLVCAPFRHQIAFHVLSDASVIPSLNAMVRFAYNGFAESAGPLSPDVYWWRDGQMRRLSRVTEEGDFAIDVDAEFGAVLETLVGIEG